MKKILSLTVAIFMLFALVACGGRTNSSEKIKKTTIFGSDDFGYLKLDGVWQELYESLGQKPPEHLPAMVYTKDSSIVDIGLVYPEDVSDELTLQEAADEFMAAYFDDFDEANRTIEESTFAGYKAILVTNTYVDPDFKEDATAKTWFFETDDKLYHYVQIDVLTADLEDVMEQVTSSFSFKRPAA